MHKELEAFFAEHEDPTHCSKRSVHDALAPLRRVATDVLKQVLEYRTLIGEAETAPHDHALDGKLEQMHQTLGALEREATVINQATRELGKAMTQLDRYMEEWKASIQQYENRAREG